MFLQVSVILSTGGACVVALGGHAWLLGGMRGCSGACVVALGGHAWLLPGGACMVAPGGHAWLLPGGVCGCLGACVVAPGGACVVAPGGGVRGFFDEIRSMSGRYASHWNAYLFQCAFNMLIINAG